CQRFQSARTSQPGHWYHWHLSESFLAAHRQKADRTVSQKQRTSATRHLYRTHERNRELIPFPPCHLTAFGNTLLPDISQLTGGTSWRNRPERVNRSVISQLSYPKLRQKPRRSSLRFFVI